MDREKVIKGLECCAAMGGYECQECPYRHECLDNDLPYGMSHLATDALALLKEHEMVVRCKDCTEYKEWGTGKICMRLGSYYGDREPDDFCSLGIRR